MIWQLCEVVVSEGEGHDRDEEGKEELQLAKSIPVSDKMNLD